MMSGAALAQVITQDQQHTYALFENGGQSFTATVTGHVTQVAFDFSANYSGELLFYEGELGSGTSGAIGTPIHRLLVGYSGANDSAFRTFNLGTPLPVVAGRTYTMILTGYPYLRFTSNNRYAGGRLISNFAETDALLDLRFQVHQVEAAPVPTLSEWAMILMGMLLAGGTAVWLLRRGRMAV